MNTPSVKKLMTLGIDKTTAEKCKELMVKFHEKHWLGGVRPDRTMAKLSELIGTHEVEEVKVPGANIMYCNQGDTYDQTILFVHGRFRVGNWGYYAEVGCYS